MAKKQLSSFFEKFLDKTSIFSNKKTLQSNYTPEMIDHRDKEVSIIANILAPSLRLEKPSNLFLYGQTGTGKTLCTKYACSEMDKISKEREIGIKIVYINCKLKRVADTEYRLIAQLIKELGVEVPATGLPTDEIYNIFIKLLEKQEKLVIIVLDEIDHLVKKTGDGIIYNITRLNSELKNCQISLVGISNDLNFIDNIDPRVKSSLSEEEIVFPPYNAAQLKDILYKRASLAFKEGVIEAGVIEKCAAYAARDHGDARRALELLRVAGEIAERREESKVIIEHLDEAEQKIERDRVVDIFKVQPRQHQLALYSIICLSKKRKEAIYTGEVYEVYKDQCAKVNLRPLTQRRLSDIVAELDMLGIINANVISKGRMGRTREITLSVPLSTMPELERLLEKALNVN